MSTGWNGINVTLHLLQFPSILLSYNTYLPIQGIKLLVYMATDICTEVDHAGLFAVCSIQAIQIQRLFYVEGTIFSTSSNRVQ